MNYLEMVLLAGGALVLGFVTLLMWWIIRHEHRKAAMTHAERQTALERGIPLQDAELARCRALGWIGVIVPVASFSAALGATALLVPPGTTDPSVGSLIAVWSSCGAAAVCGVIAAIARLRNVSGGSKAGGPSESAYAEPFAGGGKGDIRNQ